MGIEVKGRAQWGIGRNEIWSKFKTILYRKSPYMTNCIGSGFLQVYKSCFFQSFSQLVIIMLLPSCMMYDLDTSLANIMLQQCKQVYPPNVTVRRLEAFIRVAE